jgi:hypothetical protein
LKKSRRKEIKIEVEINEREKQQRNLMKTKADALRSV